MEETLPAALGRIFPSAALRPAVAADVPRAAPPAAAAAIDELVSQAQAHYRRAIQAQREGDWAQYGEEIKKLGDVLERINARR
jgi:uncharacterized membrane protein (UPF0182 family)